MGGRLDGRALGKESELAVEYLFKNGAMMRAATLEDLAELFVMVQDLYTEPGDAPRELAPLRRTLEEAARHPDKLACGIISYDQQVIGYCLVCFFWSHEFGGNIVEIDEIYLKRPFRCQGMGRELLAALPELYPEAVGLTLCTNIGNQRAAALYRAAGFEPSPFWHMLKIFAGRQS